MSFAAFSCHPQHAFCEGDEGLAHLGPSQVLTSHCLLSLSAQAAGNAVKRASDNLVKAAQKAAAFEEQENETVVVKEKMVGGIAQVSSEGCQQGNCDACPGSHSPRP